MVKSRKYERVAMKSEVGANLLAVKSESWLDLSSAQLCGMKRLQCRAIARDQDLQAAPGARFQRSQSVNPSPQISERRETHLLIRARQRSFLNSRSTLHSQEDTNNSCSLSHSVELNSTLIGNGSFASTSDNEFECASARPTKQQRVGAPPKLSNKWLQEVNQEGRADARATECSSQIKREPFRLRSFRNRLQRRTAAGAGWQTERHSWSSLSERLQSSARLWSRGCQIVERTWKNILASSRAADLADENFEATAPECSAPLADEVKLTGVDDDDDRLALDLVRRRITRDWVSRLGETPAVDHCQSGGACKSGLGNASRRSGPARGANRTPERQESSRHDRPLKNKGRRCSDREARARLKGSSSNSFAGCSPASIASSAATLVSGGGGGAGSASPSVASSESSCEEPQNVHRQRGAHAKRQQVDRWLIEAETRKAPQGTPRDKSGVGHDAMDPKWQQTLTSDYWTGTPTSVSGCGERPEQQQQQQQFQRSRRIHNQRLQDSRQSYLASRARLEQLASPVAPPYALGGAEQATLQEEDYADYAVPADEHCCRLDRSQVELVQLIGEGQKGYVFLGKLQSRDGRQMIDVAIKTLKYETEQLIGRLMSEAAMMRSLEHPHIIRFIGMCPETPALIAMELAKFGEIKQYLKLNQHLIRCSQLVLFAFQISTALSYLESKNFVHRDVAARNVLVCSHQCVKLADFGLSRNLLQQQQHEQLGDATASAAAAQYVAAPRVKLPVRWLAPESLVFRRFTSASDVWMFAVCAWELFEWGQTRPWPQLRNHQVLAAIESGQRLARPLSCPARLYQLMLQCWSYAPVQRPKFREIKQSIWSIYLSERTREQLELERIEHERQRLLVEGTRQQQAASSPPMILGAAAAADAHQYYYTPPAPSVLDESEQQPVAGQPLPISAHEIVHCHEPAAAAAAAKQKHADSERVREDIKQRAAALEAASRRFARAHEQARHSGARPLQPGQLQKQRSQGAIATGSSSAHELSAAASRLRRGADDTELTTRRQQNARNPWRRSQGPLGGAARCTPNETEEEESCGSEEEEDNNNNDGDDDDCERRQIAEQQQQQHHHHHHNQHHQLALERLQGATSKQPIWPQSAQQSARNHQRLVSASPALTQASECASVRHQPNYDGLVAVATQATPMQQYLGRVAMLRAHSGSPALLGVHSASPVGSVSPVSPGGSCSPASAAALRARPTSWRQQQPSMQVDSRTTKQPATHELGQVLQALRLTPMKAKLKGPPEQTVRVLSRARHSPLSDGIDGADESELINEARFVGVDDGDKLRRDGNNNNNNNSGAGRFVARAPDASQLQSVPAATGTSQAAELERHQQLMQKQLHQRLLHRMIRSPTSVGAGSGSEAAQGRTRRQASFETVDQSLQILQSLMSPNAARGARSSASSAFGAAGATNAHDNNNNNNNNNYWRARGC